MDGGPALSAAAVLATVRRMLRRHPASTTVTVTRVVGGQVTDAGEPVPDTVVVTTREPEPDTAAHKLARAALGVALIAVALAAAGVTWRILQWRTE